MPVNNERTEFVMFVTQMKTEKKHSFMCSIHYYSARVEAVNTFKSAHRYVDVHHEI